MAKFNGEIDYVLLSHSDDNFTGVHRSLDQHTYVCPFSIPIDDNFKIVDLDLSYSILNNAYGYLLLLVRNFLLQNNQSAGIKQPSSIISSMLRPYLSSFSSVMLQKLSSFLNATKSRLLFMLFTALLINSQSL
jgi:hypothetical protein